MKVKIERSAYKDLKKIPPSKRKKIFKKIDLLIQYPLCGKQLEGQYRGLRSLRIWPYRIIYLIDRKKQIWVVSILHRQGAYK